MLFVRIQIMEEVDGEGAEVEKLPNIDFIIRLRISIIYLNDLNDSNISVPKMDTQ